MKRDLKFRAWARTGKWDESGEKRQFEIIDGDSLAPMEFEPFKDSLKDIDDEYYVMQFTGLHDCHGVEIYEGDIVKVGEACSESGMFYNSFIGKIEYNAPYFYVSQSDNFVKTGKWSGQEYQWDELEVIGNIYENKLLLK